VNNKPITDSRQAENADARATNHHAYPSFRLPSFPRFSPARHHPDIDHLEKHCRPRSGGAVNICTGSSSTAPSTAFPTSADRVGPTHAASAVVAPAHPRTAAGRGRSSAIAIDSADLRLE
jgi:hypothetical protein